MIDEISSRKNINMQCNREQKIRWRGLQYIHDDLADWGGYFCVLLFPIVYPGLKAVKPRLITAIRPSSVTIGIPSFSQLSVSGSGDFYVIGGVLSAGGTRLAPTVTECRVAEMHRRICHALYDVHLAARMPKGILEHIVQRLSMRNKCNITTK